MKKLLFTLLIGSSPVFLGYSQALARQDMNTLQPNSAECNMVDISVSFSFEGTTSAYAKNELDDRLFKLNGFLVQNHIDRLETQSLCYKIGLDLGKNRVQPNKRQVSNPDTPPVYKLIGTAEYLIDSSDSAFRIGQFLTKQKFEVTVSNKVGKNVQCNAPVTSAPVVPEVKAVVTTPKTPASKAPPDLSDIFKAKPPSLEKEPTPVDNTNTHNKNGPIPTLPGLNQDPPDAQPLQGNR